MNNYKHYLGKKVRVNALGKSVGFSCDTVTLTKVHVGTGSRPSWYTDYQNYVIYLDQFNPFSLTKDELEKSRDSLMTEVSEVNTKLNWMTETGNKEYDEDEFKAWGVLGIIDSSDSKINKAKAIAKLIKGE